VVKTYDAMLGQVRTTLYRSDKFRPCCVRLDRFSTGYSMLEKVSSVMARLGQVSQG
jgi:hypothetical protein